MAQLMTVKLSRFDSQPWGFRLQGGKDFGQPLVIQKVNGNSLAEKAGLQAGDALIRVNNVDLFNLAHKEAQNALVRAGNSFEITVQRGGSTWKPSVTPVGPSPVISSQPAVQPVTKTSLAYKQPPAQNIPAHNLTPKPFGGAQLNGDTGKSLASKLYNTPVGLYSDENIAETLSAQAEVLAGGVLGVNFKKNEKTYNAANSEVLKMVQEIDSEPRDAEPAPPSAVNYYSTASHAVGGRAVSPRPVTPLATQLPPPSQSEPASQTQNVTSETPKCSGCERFIIGVFVRIKDKNLHVECFKCATCGSSLKNVGYYNINNKLYCDIHAKLAARSQAPAPNLDPVTVSPGGRIPPGAFISSALSSNVSSGPAPFLQNQPLSSPVAAAPISPQPGTLGPLPFHAPTANPQQPKPINQPSVPSPLARPQPGGSGSGGKGATFAGATAPIRGRGVLTQPTIGMRVPICGVCSNQIRGPFITALGKLWCPDHFICSNGQCKRPLADIGFVEEQGQLYCEFCFEKYIAPACDKCNKKIKGDCLNAIGKHFHPECFNCAYCSKLFGNNPFFLEDGLPYCEQDWNELFTTKCFACGFPIEAGDRWVEALNNNYHSQCFNCTMCKKNLEGQSFFAKGGRPFCKTHAR